MRIIKNGENTDMAEGITISRLLQKEGYRPERIAVEVNLKIIPKERYAETVLSEGDVVEIVTFMCGG